MNIPVTILKTPSRKSSFVYTLPRYVDDRPTRPHATNACHAMMDTHRVEIEEYLPALYKRLEAYESQVYAGLANVRSWAEEFESAYWKAALLPTRRRGVFVEHGDTVNMTGPQKALWFLLETKDRGVTVAEIKVATNRWSHAPSGAMSELHAAGVAACLTARR
jgi:hypothetical protein